MITPHLVRGRALRHYQAGRRLVRDALFRWIQEHAHSFGLTPLESSTLAAHVVTYLIGSDEDVLRPIFMPRDADLVRELADYSMIEHMAARQAVIATLQLREIFSEIDYDRHPLQARAENKRFRELLLAYENDTGPPSAEEYFKMAQGLRVELPDEELAAVATA